MHKNAAAGRAAHRPHAVAHPLVAEIIGPPPLLSTGVQPGVIVSSAEDQSVELLRTGRAEQGEIQFSGAIAFPENQAEGVFRRFLRPAAPTPMNPQAAVDDKSGPATRRN